MTRATLLFALAASLCAAADLATVKPESVGFSTERLQNVHELIQHEVDGNN